MRLAMHRWILAALGAFAAAMLFGQSLSTHLHNACVELDTPYLPLCPDRREDVARAELLDRLERNPGDSTAWTSLLAGDTQDATRSALPGAILVAPHQHSVARWRALLALESGKVEEGVAVLVGILRYRTSPESAKVLAQIAVTPEGLALLRPHMRTAQRWLPQVLAAGRGLKQSPSQLLPLVAMAQSQGRIAPQVGQDYMRSLKAAGLWLDAYGFWVAQHKDTVPLLYNGSFDQPFVSEGFDWEIRPMLRSRAGYLVDQESVARRGMVLAVEFTGRTFTVPVVRQFMLTPPGTYRLRGDYMVLRLRSEQGLAWTVQCPGKRSEVGRSEALRDTGGAWRQLEFEFTVPADCGPVVSVQLEPSSPLDAQLGMRGAAAFDAFKLAPSVSGSDPPDPVQKNMRAIVPVHRTRSPACC